MFNTCLAHSYLKNLVFQLIMGLEKPVVEKTYPHENLSGIFWWYVDYGPLSDNQIISIPTISNQLQSLQRLLTNIFEKTMFPNQAFVEKYLNSKLNFW